MGFHGRLIVRAAVLLAVLSVESAAGGQEAAATKLPTHADAAIILAKHSGFFTGYVAPEATLNECVAFLNKAGIYFGLMEVINGKEFAMKDCARAMGQIELVLSGGAEYSAGKVKLPIGVASWEEFCILNGVDYAGAYEHMLDVLNRDRI